MPSWPESFPPLFSTDGASLDSISNATLIDTESGEPLTRVRFTGEMDNVSASLPMCDRATAIAIRDFWRNDLKNGTLRMTWDDPLSLDSREFLMLSPPRIVPFSGDNWQVSLQLMAMPI